MYTFMLCSVLFSIIDILFIAITIRNTIILFSLFIFILITSHDQMYYFLLYRGGDCHQAFLPHRECVCYDRCPRCCVEFELDVNFDKFNQTRPDQEKDLPLTVTSRDLVRIFCVLLCGFHSSFTKFLTIS